MHIGRSDFHCTETLSLLVWRKELMNAVNLLVGRKPLGSWWNGEHHCSSEATARPSALPCGKVLTLSGELWMELAHCRAALTTAWKAAQICLLNSNSDANKPFEIFCRGWAFMTHLHVKIIWVWSLGLLLLLLS